MGSLFMKDCMEPDKQEPKINEKSVVLKSDLHYDPQNRISQAQFVASPENNNMLGFSALDNSTMNSFYKENEIGPFLVQPERSNSYKQKMKKWQSVIQQCPRSKENQKCAHCDSVAGFNDTIIEKQNKHNHQCDYANELFHENDQTTVIIEPHKCTYKNKKDNSFDIPAFQKTFKFVTNKLDTAVVAYNIMDKQGFKDSLIEGPPDMRLRWSCWKISLLMKNQKQEFDFESILSEQVCSLVDDTIKKDIKRTISHHKFFQAAQDQCSFGHEQLSRLLKGISNAFPSLGYCQGMNFFAGIHILNYITKAFFLLTSGGDERQTFQCFIQLLQNPKFMIYHIFCPGLPFLIFLENLTNDLIKEYFPKIRQHLDYIELPNSFWIQKMILSMFLYCFNFKTCLRMWDFIFATNIFGLVSLILAFLEVSQNDILQLDMCEFMIWFQSKSDEDLNMSEIITLASEKYRISKTSVSRYAKKSKIQNQFVKILEDYHNKQKFSILYRQLIQRETELYLEKQQQSILDSQSNRTDCSVDSHYQSIIGDEKQIQQDKQQIL